MSFFEALVEGTANAAANSLGNYQKRQQMLDDEERTNANALDKYKQQIQIQQDMAEQARQAKQERLQTQIAQAEEEGGKLTRAQALAALNKDYGSNLTEDDVLPEELDAYGPNDLGKIDNKLKAARSAGLYDAADSLGAERKATVDAMREAFKEQIQLRNAANSEAKTEAMIRHGDQQFEASMAHWKAYADKGSAGRGGADGLGKLVTEKNAALREVTQLATQLKDASNKDKPAIRTRMGAAQENLDRLNRLLADARGGTGEPAPAAPEKPAAKPQSTKDLAAKPGQRPDINSFFK